LRTIHKAADKPIAVRVPGVLIVEARAGQDSLNSHPI